MGTLKGNSFQHSQGAPGELVCLEKLITYNHHVGLNFQKVL